jgi:hypothetical protein
MANEFKVKKGLIVEGSGGTILDIQGSVGQLFSITDSLTGDLFAVSDISGIPILNVNSSGAVDIDGDLSVTDDVTLSNFGAGYLKTNVNGVVSNTATIPWSTVSSTPTTISGYGITDAFDGSYSSLSGTPTLGTAAAAATGDFAAAAHDHSRILERSTITYGDPQLQWTDLNGNGGTGLNGAAPGNPFSDWFHHIIMNHANNSGYYVDIAACFHSDDLYFRRNVGGTLSAWREIYHTGNLTPLTIGTTATTAMAGNTLSAQNITDIGNLSGTNTGDQDLSSYLTAETFSSSDVVMSIDGNDLTAGVSVSLAGGLSYNVSTNTLTQTDNNTVYVHPTSAGNKHIPTGGAAGQFLKYSSSGTAVWATPSYTTNTDTTYSAGSGLDLTSTTFSVEPDLRDGITHVGVDGNNYIQFDSTNRRIDFYADNNFVARMESDGDLHIKGDVIAFSDIFS